MNSQVKYAESWKHTTEEGRRGKKSHDADLFVSRGKLGDKKHN